MIRGRTDLVVAASLFLVSAAVFRLSPAGTVSDSHYTLLMAETLLRTGGLDLSASFRPPLDRARYPGVNASGLPYQVQRVGEKVRPYYGPGAALLSVPFMAVMNAAGRHAMAADGGYDLVWEVRLQHLLAALLMAAMTAVLYLTARRLLPPAPSAVAALAAALATPVWSTASRAVWSDTWGMALTSIVLLALVVEATAGPRLPSAVLGTLLAWLYLTKPSYVAVIVPVTLYAALRERRRLAPLVATGAAWLALFVLYARALYGAMLPDYYRKELGLRQVPEALAGNLVSPSRGLLVYCPLVLYVLVLAASRRRALPHAPLAVLCAAAIVLHVLLVATVPIWWAGHAYGPRYMAPLVPWLYLLAVLALAAPPAATSCWGGPRARAAGIVLLLASVAMNAIGALDRATEVWNVKPYEVDAARVWDVRYPQFLASVLVPPLPRELPPLEVGWTLPAGNGATDCYFWRGFGDAEGTSRWTVAREAGIAFVMASPRAARVTLVLRPFLSPPLLSRQHVHVVLNGVPVAERALEGPEAAIISFDVAPSTWRERNQLLLKLPDAASPRSLGAGGDGRALGVALERIDVAAPGDDRPLMPVTMLRRGHHRRASTAD